MMMTRRSRGHGDGAGIPAAARLIAGICAYAPFLTGILRRHPEWLTELLHADPDAAHAAILATARQGADGTADESDVMRTLRVAREKNALLIALADLGGVWDVTRRHTRACRFCRCRSQRRC